MAIWTRRRRRGEPAPTPIELQVDVDLAAVDADADTLIATSVAEAATHAQVARNRADKVIIGFTLGADLDLLEQDIDRFERTGDDRSDLLAARQLDARAVHLGNQALAQQRQNDTRAVTGLAAVYLSTNPPNDHPTG